MQVAVSSTGQDLSDPVSPIFGRCPYYLVVDSETLAFEALPNPAVSAAGGAGVQAAQLVVEQDVEVILTGNVGPNAFRVLQAAGVKVYRVADGTVRETVEAFRSGELMPLSEATNSGHFGTRGRGRGRGRRGG